MDDHGHGTHVTGIITSDGGSSPEGAASQTEIVAVKVLDDNNAFCCTSDVVKALDHLVDDQPDVDLVNMSLGTFALYTGACDDANSANMALSALVGTLRDRGVITFAASMNNGCSALREPLSGRRTKLDLGLCYQPCRMNYSGAGPMCWEDCPDDSVYPGYADHGATCYAVPNIIEK